MIFFCINGDYWLNSDNWLSNDTDYCDWYGIRCCKVGLLNEQCINFIVLDNNNLTGTLPNWWFNSNIFDIFSILNDNSDGLLAISGEIPDFSTNLPNMAAILLANHQFSGTLPKYGIANCTYYYDVERNRFEGTKKKNNKK